MQVLPVDDSNLASVTAWLFERENYKWLDFRAGSQPINACLLKVMVQKPAHLLRVYTAEPDEAPAGLVALSNILLADCPIIPEAANVRP